MKYAVRCMIILVATLCSSCASVGGLGAALGEYRAATRVFAGPDQYPPQNYAAYAVVAFPGSPSEEDNARFNYICRAYMGTLEPPGENQPPEEQLVTIWPVRSNPLATDLNKSDRVQSAETCKKAVDDYDDRTSGQAIRAARSKGIDVSGIGPYLIAWSPTNDLNGSDTVILFMNLSPVSDFRSAADYFRLWAKEIEADRSLWSNGFSQARLRVKFRAIVNDYGRQFEEIFWVRS